MVLSTGLTALILVCVAVLFGVVTWIVLLFMQKNEERVEEPFILNLMPQFSKGHCFGLEVSTEKVGDRYLVTYSPRDINKLSLKEDNFIENVKVVVDKDKIINFSKGTLSNYRTFKILLAKNPEDYPTTLKQTTFGKSIMGLTEVINTVNVETNVVREGSDRKTNILYKMGDGELTSSIIEKFQEIAKDMVKSIRDEKSQPAHLGGLPPRM